MIKPPSDRHQPAAAPGLCPSRPIAPPPLPCCSAHLPATGKPLSKCGKCKRYMRLITARPMRLYCNTCEELLAMPQVRVLRVNACVWGEAEVGVCVCASVCGWVG